MHSFGFRFNAAVTFVVMILTLICGSTWLPSSNNFNAASPTADVKVLNINWFQEQPNGNDEVNLTLNVSANLQSLFTWNTNQVLLFVAAEYETSENALNQVFLWDGIIQAKEDATNKCKFIDQGNNLCIPTCRGLLVVGTPIRFKTSPKVQLNQALFLTGKPSASKARFGSERGYGNPSKYGEVNEGFNSKDL